MHNKGETILYSYIHPMYEFTHMDLYIIHTYSVATYVCKMSDSKYYILTFYIVNEKSYTLFIMRINDCYHHIKSQNQITPL